ncbi:Hydrogenase transcriptional regulatory protein hupR1 [Thalassovita gelatinovora]|uniref:Hydrogenase transcriptional regulatory protein hupR1 n=1 Tax=Thalassovita gelatinovora TaxID=53501 RepID=A0A0P1FK74_THAGE|nr:response regulator [Thalassovita gelatinovora]QIZ82391.1 response regulator [Thalassovita gelatinovora]CUH68472.1 Hydrogenase transcriptional regulatory protein hupR1 [Thalassovita gelatinovora]SEQ52916.1 regulatory protein, Fis family [Thalassovita gelatinovora]
MLDDLSTVLLVDDEDHLLAAMRMALEDDFDCICAGNADAAMAVMEDQFVQVIFCDQRMPGRSGVEYLIEVRDRWPEIVRIIITGYTETNDMIAAINEAEIYQFLTKPWHPGLLVMTAKNAADVFRLNRECDRMSLKIRCLSRSVESKLEEKRKVRREELGFENVLRETLTRLKWNTSRTAAELGLNRVELRAKIDRYGIAEPGKFETCGEEEE